MAGHGSSGYASGSSAPSAHYGMNYVDGGAPAHGEESHPRLRQALLLTDTVFANEPPPPFLRALLYAMYHP